MEPVSNSDTIKAGRQKKEEKETKEISPEKQNVGMFVRAEIFGGKLKVFIKDSDPNDPRNYRDPMPQEMEIYEERSKAGIITPEVKAEKKIEVKVDNDKTKEKKEEVDLTDPYNWYINENLRLKK